MFRLTLDTVRRARQERLPQMAGSLSFTTLLSMVPLLAVSLALFTRFPLFDRFEAALERYLLQGLLPADIARTVLRYLSRFAANAGELTLVGTLFLVLAAIALLLTVENAFNQIWGVKRNRPFVQRVAIYLLILAVGPLLLGVSLWATSYVFGVSLGLLGPLPPAAHFVLDLGPAALAWASLSALFFYLPNTQVRKRDAIIGALLASVLIELGKRGFTAYLLKLPTYKAVYGSFAVIPLFLLWLHFSWLATLGSALVAANMGRGAAGAGAKRRDRVTTRDRT